MPNGLFALKCFFPTDCIHTRILLVYVYEWSEQQQQKTEFPRSQKNASFSNYMRALKSVECSRAKQHVWIKDCNKFQLLFICMGVPERFLIWNTNCIVKLIRFHGNSDASICLFSFLTGIVYIAFQFYLMNVLTERWLSMRKLHKFSETAQ